MDFVFPFSDLLENVLLDTHFFIFHNTSDLKLLHCVCYCFNFWLLVPYKAIHNYGLLNFLEQSQQILIFFIYFNIKYNNRLSCWLLFRLLLGLGGSCFRRWGVIIIVEQIISSLLLFFWLLFSFLFLLSFFLILLTFITLIVFLFVFLVILIIFFTFVLPLFDFGIALSRQFFRFNLFALLPDSLEPVHNMCEPFTL